MNLRRRTFALDRKRNATSLLEVLLVLAILSLLVQLLVVALQASRGAARRLQCVAKLRRLGIAASLHHDDHGQFPSGGWHFTWVGEPERGAGPRQPGGWAYSLLPYLDQTALFHQGRR